MGRFKRPQLSYSVLKARRVVMLILGGSDTCFIVDHTNIAEGLCGLISGCTREFSALPVE